METMAEGMNIEMLVSTYLIPWGINLNVRPWVNTADYWVVWFDLTERIKLAFDDSGISLPFPQMDAHLEKVG